MGQQQLLLLVLGIVIVGLAVVAGINAFQENQEKSTQDAIVNEGMRIATDIQAWRLKPDEFGGGGGSYATDASTTMSSAIGSANVSGAIYESAWGDIKLDQSSTPAKLKLNKTDGTDATFGTITITESGSPTFSGAN